jgi:hypothetical protein
MNCGEAKAWLISKGYIPGANQTFSGGVGNRVINMLR